MRLIFLLILILNSQFVIAQKSWGIIVRDVDKGNIIINLIKYSPLHNAGANCVNTSAIIKINNTPVNAATIEEAMATLKALPEGDNVFTIWCNGEEKNYIAQRSVLEVGKCIDGNCENGIGTYEDYVNTTTYKGGFKNKLRNGKGTIISEQVIVMKVNEVEAIYYKKMEGEFVNEVPQKGTIYAAGITYTGNLTPKFAFDGKVIAKKETSGKEVEYFFANGIGTVVKTKEAVKPKAIVDNDFTNIVEIIEKHSYTSFKNITGELIDKDWSNHKLKNSIIKNYTVEVYAEKNRDPFVQIGEGDDKEKLKALYKKLVAHCKANYDFIGVFGNENKITDKDFIQRMEFNETANNALIKIFAVNANTKKISSKPKKLNNQ